MIDSHCHLEFRHFDEDREEVIERAKGRIKALVDSSAEIEMSENVIDLHDSHPDFIFSTLGLHPTYAVKSSDEEIEEYIDYIGKNVDKIVGVGEVGLDYYHIKDKSKRVRAREVFERFIKLSDQLDLPLVVHSRNSTSDVMEILEGKEGDVIIHCFSGGVGEVHEAVDRGYYLSFGGMVFRSENKYRDILQETPIDNLLLETDAPFLAKRKSDRSEPWLIREVADKIAEIKGLEKSKVWKVAGQNAKEAYDLPVSL